MKAQMMLAVRGLYMQAGSGEFEDKTVRGK